MEVCWAVPYIFPSVVSFEDALSDFQGYYFSSFCLQNNSLERAVDWIFSHIDDLDAEAAMDISEGRSAAESISESVPAGPKVRDGPGSEFERQKKAWLLNGLKTFAAS